MKKEFLQYLATVGMTESLIHRVEEIHKIYLSILGQESEDIFVTDFLDQEGIRHYDSLWFFSNAYWMEAKNFLANYDLDYARIGDSVTYWQIQMTDYDFVKANEKSRISINVSSKSGIKCTFRGSKENCDFLKDIFLKRARKLSDHPSGGA